MRILVTGGAGFLGRNLCKSLLDDGHEVLCLDNFQTGSRRNVEAFLAQKQFTLIEHDVTEPIVIDGPLDQIFNLACPASPPHYQKDPVGTLRINVLGAINVLELAKEKSSRVLQASTSEIYGEPLEHPQSESYRGNVNPIGPRACYDEGKRAAETLFFDYHRERGVDVTVARIFNTYGPFMDPADGRVVSNFVVAALANNPLTLHGDGSQTRSFCFVDDLVRGLRALMDSGIAGPVNLGNPDEHTIKELAELVVALTESDSIITSTNNFRTDDPMRRRPDISLAKKELGWEPAVGWKDGLMATIKFFSK